MFQNLHCMRLIYCNTLKFQDESSLRTDHKSGLQHSLFWRYANYFGGARSKGFATLRNVSKLPFFDKIGHAKSVGFRFYSAIWQSESRISSRYHEITSISLIDSLTFSRKKEFLFWLSRGLNQLTCVTRQIRGDSKLRDLPIGLLRPKVVRDMKNSYEITH